MKIYCPQCGGPTMYSGAKPKFCSSCGNALSALGKNKKDYIIHEDIDIEKDPSEYFDFGNMDKLEVEITNEPNNNKVTFGELMENSADAKMDGDVTFTNKKSAPRQNSKEVIKQFQKEAGSLKKNKDA